MVKKKRQGSGVVDVRVRVCDVLCMLCLQLQRFQCRRGIGWGEDGGMWDVVFKMWDGTHDTNTVSREQGATKKSSTVLGWSRYMVLGQNRCRPEGEEERAFAKLIKEVSDSSATPLQKETADDYAVSQWVTAEVSIPCRPRFDTITHS